MAHLPVSRVFEHHHPAITLGLTDNPDSIQIVLSGKCVLEDVPLVIDVSGTDLLGQDGRVVVAVVGSVDSSDSVWGNVTGSCFFPVI
jgi:hypothetical protein